MSSRLVATQKETPNFMEFCFNFGFNSQMAIRNVIYENREVEYEDKCGLKISSRDNKKVVQATAGVL